MSQDNYNIPMTDEAFEDIKQNAIRLWETYDNEFGYVDDKVARIKDIENIGDNAMYIIAMFDNFNIIKLFRMLKPETQRQLEDDRLPEVLIF